MARAGRFSETSFYPPRAAPLIGRRLPFVSVRCPARNLVSNRCAPIFHPPKLMSQPRRRILARGARVGVTERFAIPAERSGCRMFVMAAVIAGVRRSSSVAVMLRYALAKFAFNPLWVEVVAKPIKAGRIVGKLTAEIVNRIFLLFRCRVVPALNVAHVGTMPFLLPTVKGYLPGLSSLGQVVATQRA